MKQKWINDGGIFYPTSGDTVIHETPGPGIFRVVKSPNPMDNRLGLIRIGDKFEFNFKLYKLGAEKISELIKKVWNSDLYIDSNRSLGVIFNGLKGTGKTISAKLLCNELDIPIIIVDNSFDGIVNFVQDLCFDCVVFIDEAEKIFGGKEDSHVLLKLVDGVYSNSRKLYLLTTNQLSINDNLLGRPGRIRYIHEFKNLPKEAVEEYVKDNLIDQSKAEIVYTQVDQLTISTIDILKSIVDEVNMLGSLGDPCELNIPKAKYVFDVLRLYGNISIEDKDKIEKVLAELMPNVNTDVFTWVNSSTQVSAKFSEEVENFEPEDEEREEICVEEIASSAKLKLRGDGDVSQESTEKEGTSAENNTVSLRNIRLLKYAISKELNKSVSLYLETMTSDSSFLYEGNSTSWGVISKGSFGSKERFHVFSIASRWDDEEDYICILARQRSNPSLYRGGLVF